MLTVVAILFLPAVFVMSSYRLYQLPRDVLAGTKWLNSNNRLVYGLASATTYLALGACVVYLVYAIAIVVAAWPVSLTELLSTASVVLGFPFVYLAYEWVYFYAITPRPKRQGCCSSTGHFAERPECESTPDNYAVDPTVAVRR